MSETPPAPADPRAVREIARRRTFAIISHPDAGKTTLTEKFLLYGGAVQLAGSVTARKNQSATTSDWMELEKQRGISVSSTVLQFEFEGYVVNLLDTPGHKDFSEDTYRVLTAVDAALMVIDAGKGIESQTLKLFEVCRRRGVPIFAFMNKLDRPARPPLALLDELERVLGIAVAPVNWPLGDGPEFKGVYDRGTREVHLFERVPGGKYRAPVQVSGVEDAAVRERLGPELHGRVSEDLALLDEASPALDAAAIRAGELIPVFFGSASNNFGVELLLRRFLDLAPPPVGRVSQGRTIAPTAPEFSGFVFKIQANMNPRHRDTVGFIRVVSGCFRRDMTVTHTRTGKPIRLANAQRMFARDRETVDEAWPGDVVGLVGKYDFQVGDTVAEDATVVYHEIPRFAPECFALLRNANLSKFKRFREGLQQLLQEGVAQLYERPDAGERVPLLGAVGPLQFEVIQYRLETEYGAECRVEPTAWTLARWIRATDPALPKVDAHGEPIPPPAELPGGVTLARDPLGHWVALFPNEWAVRYFSEKNPGLTVSATPFAGSPHDPVTRDR
jgi:peptide chain release factor 3